MNIVAPIRNDHSAAPVIVAVFGVFSYSILDASLKSVSLALPIVQVVFLRFIFGSVFAVAVFLWSGQKWPGREAMPAAIARAVISAASISAFTFAVSILPLANAVVLTYSAPIFMAVFGRIFLGEPVTPRAALAIAIGFAGILVTLLDRLVLSWSVEFLLGSLSAVASGASYALSMILARMRSSRDSVEFTVLAQNVFSAAIMLPFAALGFALPGWPLAGSFALIGLSGTIAQFLVVWAWSRTAATRLAPIEFTSILWAGLFGFIFFHERPTLLTLCGALLIAASGVLVATRRSVPVETA